MLKAVVFGSLHISLFATLMDSVSRHTVFYFRYPHVTLYNYIYIYIIIYMRGLEIYVAFLN